MREKTEKIHYYYFNQKKSNEEKLLSVFCFVFIYKSIH